MSYSFCCCCCCCCRERVRESLCSSRDNSISGVGSSLFVLTWRIKSDKCLEGTTKHKGRPNWIRSRFREWRQKQKANGLFFFGFDSLPSFVWLASFVCWPWLFREKEVWLQTRCYFRIKSVLVYKHWIKTRRSCI